MSGYNHYIRVDQAGIIIYGFSSAFEDPKTDDICILQDGPRQFQEVWTEPLTNERGQYRYKWIEGQRMERSADELDAEWAARPPAPPTVDDQIALMQKALDDLILGGAL